MSGPAKSPASAAPSQPAPPAAGRARRSILHLTPFAVRGGCEVNCLRIIQGCREADHRVLVFDGPGSMSGAWKDEGAAVAHLGAWAGRLSAFRAALAHWSGRAEAPDAIIYWSTSRLPSVLAGLRQWPVPWVVHLGNPAPSGALSLLRRRLQERVRRRSPRVTLVACSKVVAASHGQSPYFRRFPIAVVYNPVDPAFDRPRSHRELPAGSSPRIGMIARLDAIKDHLTLIRAVAAAAPNRPDLVLEFAGDGALAGRLKEEAAALGVGDRVRFLGHTDVRPLLGQWDIYAHSTTEREGMGTAVAEAMMAGLPCLVSDLPVMREVCGRDAVYADAGDASSFGRAMLRMAGDRWRRQRLGSAAQARARETFGLGRAVEGYLGVLFPSGRSAAA